jgi:hypothetical protein
MMGIGTNRKPAKKRIRRRLQTPADVRKYLAKIMYEVEIGDIDPVKGGRIAYMANILIRSMQEDFQQNQFAPLLMRMKELEKKRIKGIL